MKKIINGISVVLAIGWTGFASAYSITDTVTVDGKEWAQVDLFIGLNWNQINTVCPGGVCAGTLNGYDMLGWTWASTDMVNALFNYYIAGTPRPSFPSTIITGDPHLGLGPDSYSESLNPQWPFPHDYLGAFARAFFADGWRPTQHVFEFADETLGLMSDAATNLGVMGHADGVGGEASTIGIDQALVFTYGGWFQRNDVAVATPATLSLFAAALGSLGWFRRKA